MPSMNLKLYIDYLFQYFPEGIKDFEKVGIRADTPEEFFTQLESKFPQMEDFLMGFLNLLYKDFDMYFFKGFTEQSLIYHLYKKEKTLRELLDAFYRLKEDAYAPYRSKDYKSKISLGKNDYYLSKLMEHNRKKVNDVLELFILLGKRVPDVYSKLEKGEEILAKREKEIGSKYPVCRQVEDLHLLRGVLSMSKVESKSPIKDNYIIAKTESKINNELEKYKKQLNRLGG